MRRSSRSILALPSRSERTVRRCDRVGRALLVTLPALALGVIAMPDRASALIDCSALQNQTLPDPANPAGSGWTSTGDPVSGGDLAAATSPAGGDGESHEDLAATWVLLPAPSVPHRCGPDEHPERRALLRHHRLLGLCLGSGDHAAGRSQGHPVQRHEVREQLPEWNSGLFGVSPVGTRLADGGPIRPGEGHPSVQRHRLDGRVRQPAARSGSAHRTHRTTGRHRARATSSPRQTCPTPAAPVTRTASSSRRTPNRRPGATSRGKRSTPAAR